MSGKNPAYLFAPEAPSREAPGSEAPGREAPSEMRNRNPAYLFKREKTSRDEGREANSSLQGLASVMGGPTLGFADEIAGVANTLRANGKSIPENYRSGRDYVRGMAEKHEEDYPIMSSVNKVASSLPLGMVGAGRAAITGIGSAIKEGAKIGAGYGAAVGAGESENERPSELMRDAVEGMGYGLAVGGVGTGAMKGIGWVGNRAGKILDEAFMPGGHTRGAARVANKAAGDLRPSVINALNRGKPGQTASQAALPAGSPEFTAMGEFSKGVAPGPYKRVDVAQKAAREGSLKAVTPDLKQVEAARAATTGPLYDAAEAAIVQPTRELNDVISRMPKGTMKRAQDIARMQGKPFSYGDQTVSGNTLHLIKLALDDFASGRADPKKYGLESTALRTVRANRAEYLGVLEDLIPGYRPARTTYASMSRRADQSKVLTKISDELKGPGGGERGGAFLNKLGRGEEALLKKTTGEARHEDGAINKILSPRQIATKDTVAKQLDDAVLEKDLASRGSKAFSKIIKEDEAAPQVPGMLSRPISVVNMLSRRASGLGSDKVDKELARLMLPENKKEMAKAMQNATPAELTELYRAIAGSFGRESSRYLTKSKKKDDNDR